MDPKTKEIMENDVQQQIIAALWQAEREGQPVKALYEAVRAGKELNTRFEERSDGTCVVRISADLNA